MLTLCCSALKLQTLSILLAMTINYCFIHDSSLSVWVVIWYVVMISVSNSRHISINLVLTWALSMVNRNGRVSLYGRQFKGQLNRYYIVEATIKISKGSLMNLSYNNQIHEQFHWASCMVGFNEQRSTLSYLLWYKILYHERSEVLYFRHKTLWYPNSSMLVKYQCFGKKSICLPAELS